MRIVIVLLLAGCGAPVEALEGMCPPAGGLVVSELAIRGTSYVEIYNASSRAFQLDDVTLSVSGSGAARKVVAEGAIAPGRYRAVPVPTLADAGGAVAIVCDEQAIDEARYGAAKTDVWALDGARPPDAVLNDLPESWCAQSGTAGGPNAPCTVSACASTTKPRRGDLLVNEVMRDPAGPDAEGEWIELYVAADGPVALAGLEVEEVGSSTRKFTLIAPPCLTVAPRTLVLLPLGGTTEPRLVRGSGLFNDSAELTLRVGGTVIDQVGIACGRSGTSCAWVDDAWCESSTPTPGEDNTCAP